MQTMMLYVSVTAYLFIPGWQEWHPSCKSHAPTANENSLFWSHL